MRRGESSPGERGKLCVVKNAQQRLPVPENLSGVGRSKPLLDLPTGVSDTKVLQQLHTGALVTKAAHLSPLEDLYTSAREARGSER